MFSSFKFFETQCDRYLKIDFSVDVRGPPTKLLADLRSHTQCKQLLKSMVKKTQNGFKIMRRLTVAHLLIIYSNNFYDFVQQFVDNPNYSSDQWLNEQCIRTYYHFLKKVVASRELFLKVKQYSVHEVGFESLFYIINLMNDMFKIVAKMPLLGRYFKDSNQIVTSTFIQTIAVQAQRHYTFFKNSLQQIVSHPRIYIKCRQDEKLIKAILQESLIILNQEMKKLFLDKYFYPYGKGIGIRLFRTQEQTEQTQKIIKGIISDHKETERNLAQMELQKTGFPTENSINIEFFQRTLKLESKNQQCVIKDLDEIGQEEEQIIPTEFNQTKVMQSNSQKQTSHHMEICQDV